MSEPLYRTQRNKRTGEVRHLVSNDGGQSWNVGDAPEETEAPSFGDVLEQVGQSGPGRRDFTDETRQGAEMDAAGPSLAEAAKVIGPALLPGGAGMGFLGRTALQGAEGALTDAAITGAETEGSLQDRAIAALAAAPRGAALGAVPSALGDAGGKALRWLAEKSGIGADLFRGAAASTPAMRQKLMEQQSDRGAPIGEAIDYGQAAIGRKIEEFGLANKFFPQSAQTYAGKLGAAKEGFGQGMGQALDDAGAQGARGDVRNVIDGIGGLRADAVANRTDQRQLAGPVYDRMVGNLEQDLARTRGPSVIETSRSNPFGPGESVRQSRTLGPEMTEMTPRELHGLKKEYETRGGYKSGEILTPSDALGKSAYRDAAGVARGELDSAMGQALPDTRAAFDKDKRDFAWAATMEALAKDRAIHDSARNMPAMQTAGLAGGGAMLGGLPGAAVGYGAGVAARKYGNDAAANALRGGEGAMEWMATKSQQAGSLGPQAIGAAHMSPGESGKAAAQSHQERVTSESRGHALEDVVTQVMQTQPQMLGPYLSKFQEAAQDEDPMRMASLLGELSRDPQFRRTVGLQLQQATGVNR